MSFLFDDEYIMRAHDKTVEKQGYDKGYSTAYKQGLKNTMIALKEFLPDFKSLYSKIISNEAYANLTEEEVRKYYDEM